MSKAGKVKGKETQVTTRFLIGGDPDLEFKVKIYNSILCL